MPAAAYQLLKRFGRARSMYLVALTIALVAPYLYWGELQFAAIGMAIVGLLAGYLYGAKSVQRCFASIPAFERDA
jgi:hypothetical protein